MKDETKIELAEGILAEICEWKYPADRIINKFFRENRSLNSKNRRFITSLVYKKLRAIQGYPEWLEKFLPENFSAEFAALKTEAPLDLRTNSLKAKREDIKIEGAEFTPHSPVGLRLKKRAALEFDGRYEVQDEGSQLVVQYAAANSGERVLEYCAGGGGKALALAAEMKNSGEITAHDANPERMKNLSVRSKRAGASIIKIGQPKGEYDLVFVDSPCSGLGTWRRNPDLKWRFKEHEFYETIALQQKILQEAAKFVKIGGRLVYVTCSILPAENEQQIAEFLQANKNFSEAKPALNLSPFKTNTDGFFAAMLVRN